MKRMIVWLLWLSSATLVYALAWSAYPVLFPAPPAWAERLLALLTSSQERYVEAYYLVFSFLSVAWWTGIVVVFARYVFPAILKIGQQGS
jgi:hypothetical protein